MILIFSSWERPPFCLQCVQGVPSNVVRSGTVVIECRVLSLKVRFIACLGMIMARDYPSTEIEKTNNRYQGDGDTGPFIEAGPLGGHFWVTIWRPYHIAEIIVTHWRSGFVFYVRLSKVSVNEWRRYMWRCWGTVSKRAWVAEDRKY